MSKNSQSGRRSLAVVAAATVIALAAGGGAVAGSLITSKDIQDKTITSADLHKNSVKTQKVKDGSLRLSDLNQKANDAIKKGGPAGPAGPAGPKGPAGPAGPAANVNALLAGESATWTANGASSFDGFTVTLVDGSGPGTSVEGTGFNHPVQTGDTISFEYTLLDGATCGAGAPRMFVVIAGVGTNSFDGNPAQCGDTKTQEVVFTVPAGGTITDVGLVYDNGNAGTVYITDVLVDGLPVFFG
jgi:hypothetical protein